MGAGGALGEGSYHMFVSHIRGVPDRWEGHERRILHHVSPDLERWECVGEVPLSSDRVIDACVHPLPGGGYRQRQGLVLDQPGSRPWDATVGRHADVVVGTDAAGAELAWVFYFTHRHEPGAATGPDQALSPHPDVPIRHATDVQVATLTVVVGRLVCDRDGVIDLDLRRATSPTRT